MQDSKRSLKKNEIYLTELNGNSELDQPLISQKHEMDDKQKGWKKHNAKETFGMKIKRILFGPSIQKVKRKIFVNGKVLPQNYQKNRIKNTKYTVLTFIPKVLFNQFKLFFNMFFLVTALTQLIPILQVGYVFTYIAPLLLVLSMTMLKEFYDDMQRWRRDNQANSEQYRKLTDQGFITIKSDQIKTGDIIEVKKGQRCPADLLLLHVDDPHGTVFVKTDQLDGETDWKLRKAVKITQDYVNSLDSQNGKYIMTFEEDQNDSSYIEEEKNQMAEQNSPNKIGLSKKSMLEKTTVSFKIDDQQKSQLLNINSYVKANEPIENIYNFLGIYKVKNQLGQSKKESLSLENTIWANIYLASGTALGQVLYAGKETRMEMNSREPRSKIGKIDLQLSFLSVILFFIMLFLTGLLMALRPPTPVSLFWVTSFMRYLILLSYLIPISLRTNLDFAKLLYSFRINKDIDIPETIARNSNIPEELGRIEYLLSDKTGTLTQNDMIFKRLALENSVYTQDDVEDIKKQLNILFKTYKEPVPDYDKIKEALNQKKKFKRNNEIVLKDLMMAISVCHNVTPVINDDGEKEYQASSPDEIALVTLAESMGLILQNREQDSMTIQNCIGETEEFRILKIFPFSSETKRMGILVRHVASKKIIFYLKGADVIMKQFLPERQRGFVDESCDELAREGLRTLVITQKVIDEQEYKKWNQEYTDADQQLDNRQQKIQNVVNKLEKNMEFLGVTGVEDKLQEEVSKCLEDIRQAGIKVWMLTGDKIETAICISISSGLKDPKHQIYLIKEIQDEVELQAKLRQFNTLSQNYVLVIDGDSLKLALEHCETLFFEAACKAPSVVCCRCSPTQKAQITEKIKLITKKVTCSIGDGGNDVGMIQQADVGIGIVGKEGKQAALAADYSINKFKYLTKLLLWHGRHSYKRTCLLSQFVLHRGLIIAFMQMIFICVFYFVSLQIFNSKLLLGYSTIFTMFPVFCLIFDEDVDKETALNYPPLYRTLQKGRELNLKTFMSWFARAIYTGTALMCLSLLWFQESFLLIQTLTFSALIFIEYMMTLTELNKLHMISVISCVSSMLVYIIIWFGLPKFFEIVRLDSWVDFYKLIAIITISYGPIVVVQFLRKHLSPTDYETIIKSSKQKKFWNTDIIQ